MAAPIQLVASDTFLGNDGNWGTFQMRIGTPAQLVYVIPATLISESWVIGQPGCSVTSASNCSDSRGGLFTNDTSVDHTWANMLTNTSLQFPLSIDSNLLGDYTDYVEYGYDTLGFSAADGSSLIQDDQVVAVLTSDDFWVGTLGLSDSTSAVDSNTKPSFVRRMYDDQKIPSLSYSYTAGADYRSSLPDLTFGGQDQARFEPNNINFTFTSQTPPLSLGVQSISAKSSNGDSTTLLQEPTTFYIDSTVSQLFLPQEACEAFVDAFGLFVDPNTLKYMLNSSAREKNLRNNASVVLELGTGTDGGDTVQVTLPYSAFDVTYTRMDVSDPKASPYFPIATPSDQESYTLGRTFLQEAYLSVNYEYQNFSVYQAIASGEKSSQVVPLPGFGNSGSTSTPGKPTDTSISVVPQSGGPSTGEIAGIVVGVVVVIAAIIGGLCFWRRNKRRQKLQNHGAAVFAPPTQAMEEKRPVPDPAQTDSYFALPSKNATAYQATRDSVFSASTGTPGELESPHVGPSTASSPRPAQYQHMGTVNELDSPVLMRAELPARKFSNKRSSQLSDGGSSSMNMQSHAFTTGGPPTLSTVSRQSLEDQRPGSAGPSVLTADSVRVSASGQAAVVHHSRNSSQRTGTIVSPQGGSYSPVNSHSPGPSIDSSMATSFNRAQNDNLVTLPATTYSRVEENPIQRVNSQDTLVNGSAENNGRISPLVERAHQVAPDTPTDGPIFLTPAGTSLGYSSNREPQSRPH